MTLTQVLPRIPTCVPRSVTPPGRICANAGLARFLVAAGALAEADIPAEWSDSLEVCQRALDAWVRRQIGPLHGLSPMFVLSADEDSYAGASHRDHGATYREATLCWWERRERQWVVGVALDAIEQAHTGLGAAVLDVLCAQIHAYPLFTPDMACSVVSYLYWFGEDDEETALDLQCGEDEAERAAMRSEMVTRQTLEQAYPAWARCWRAKPPRGAALGRLARDVTDPRVSDIVADAMALSRLRVGPAYRPEIDGEDLAWGAVLSWREDDLTVRVYDDLLEMAHQGEFCDRMGEVRLPLNRPEAMADWRRAMRTRFRAIGLIDRLLHALSAGDWNSTPIRPTR